MATYDRFLIDPSEAELVRALGAAARVANRRLGERRRLERTAETWRRSVRLHARRAEGRQVWTAGRGGAPAAHVEMAWWTDPLGRRHVRVKGERLGRTGRQAARSSPFKGWPLWHLYPERLLLSEWGGRKELLAFCGCGAAGPPEALAWMGERCGPCHDRREEGGPAHFERPGVLHAPRGPGLGIAFAPDGRELAGLGADGKVRLWDCATGEGRLLHERSAGHATAFAFAPDGETVAVGCNPGLLLLDRGGRRRRLLTGSTLYVFCLGYSPDGRFLAVGGYGGNGNRLFDLSRRAAAGAEWLPGRAAVRLAFAPDGRHLYAVDLAGALFRVPLPAGPEVMFEAGVLPPQDENAAHYPPAVALACSPDGRYVAAAAANAGRRRFHVYEPDTGRARALRPPPLGPVLALAFAPDGRSLACGGGWPGNARLWDVLSGELRAVLTWGGGALGTRALAFSPEGDTLAAADADGTVRLLPWRQVCNLPG
jgi:hypothetical protein